MEEDRTLPDLLDEAAARNPGGVVATVLGGLRLEALTNAGLEDLTRRYATLLRDVSSFPAGARVVVCAPNSPELVAAFIGIMRAGMVAVPLDVGSSDGFVRRVLERTEAVALVTSGRRHRFPEGSLFDLEDRPATRVGAFTGNVAGPDDLAEIVFTSGTTGDPKGVMLTHRNVVSDVLAVSATVPPDVPRRLMSILPLSHMLEQTAGLFLPLCGGGSIHYAAGPQPLAVLREMRRVRPTGMVVVPRFLQMLGRAVERQLGHDGAGPVLAERRALAARLPIAARRALFPRFHRALGGRFRYFLCGGARLPAGAAEFWESVGIRVIEGYGATECSPVIATNIYDDRRHGTVGRALAGVELRLAGDGELQVRGPVVTAGYWHDRERTAAAFTDDGWFRTGDVADIDAGGVVSLKGRLGERLVLASGMKVYPEDVEDELRREGAIRDCAVVAVPDDTGHDQVHAVVIPRDGDGARGVAEAIGAVNLRLASHQRITGHTLWTARDFPRSTLGKVVRREVQRTLAAERASASEDGVAPSPSPDDALATVRGLLAAVIPGPSRPVDSSSDLVADLGLDSLGRVELVAVAEQRLGIELDETQLGALRTVGELAALLASSRGAPDVSHHARWPRTPVAAGLRRLLQDAVLLPAHGLLAPRFEVVGSDRLRRARGPVLLIANHSSHVDTVSIIRALPADLRRRTSIAAASDYFYANRVLGGLFSLLLNTFPFSRSGAVRDSFDRCGMVVDEGWSVLIYPEGTRSESGRLLPFKKGIGLLARGLRLPVVPVAVTGGQDILPKNAWFPRRAPVTVRFGDPIDIDPALRPDEITASLEGAVAALLRDPVTGGPSQPRARTQHAK